MTTAIRYDNSGSVRLFLDSFRLQTSWKPCCSHGSNFQAESVLMRKRPERGFLSPPGLPTLRTSRDSRKQKERYKRLILLALIDYPMVCICTQCKKERVILKNEFVRKADPRKKNRLVSNHTFRTCVLTLALHFLIN